jgi:pimeloyl-ACP methyl ester carboxylesterase
VEPTLTVPSSDGVTVAVHDLGGEGPPLLVCHATGFNGGAYAPFARALHQDRHVWALDFRGHGSSTPPTSGAEGFGWDHVVHDLLAVLDLPELQASGGAIDLVGHSMGGAVIAMAELAQPGCVRSAYLFEPIIAPDGFPSPAPGSNPMAEAARRRRATFPSKAAALWNYASKPPLNSLSAASLAAYVDHAFTEAGEGGTATLHPTPDDEAAVFEGAGKVAAADAAALQVPVTVAVGTTEIGWGPAHFVGAIVEALPDGTRSDFPELGHFGPLEAPTIVAADVRRHLARLD